MGMAKQSTIGINWKLDTTNFDKAMSMTNDLKNHFDAMINPLSKSVASFSDMTKVLSTVHTQFNKTNEAAKLLNSNNSKTSDSIKKINSENELATKSMQKMKSELDQINKSYAETIKSAQSFNEKTKTSVTKTQQLGKALKDLNHMPTITPKVDMSKVKEQTQSMPKMHLFGGVTLGVMAGNAISSVFSKATEKIKEAAASGMEYDQEQQKMNATWTTLIGDATKAKSMVSTVNNMAVQTGQDTGTVDEIEQGFYHLHSNKNESDTMTKSMLNMSDAVGLKTPQIQAVTQDMVNGLSRGSANNGMLNQISQYFPMFREQLAKYEAQIHHSKNVTTADLANMAKKGKISAQDIENVFSELGNQKYSKAADNMLETMTGMQRTIKARVPALVGAFLNPIMEAKNPFYSTMSKWVSDKRTEKEFSKMGDAATKGINTIVNAFAKAYNVKNGTKTLDDATTNIANGITSISNAIAANAPEIKEFFTMTKDSGVLGFKLFAAVMKDVSKITLPFLEFISKHQKVVVPFLAGLFVTKKALGFASALKAVAKNMALVTAAEKVNSGSGMLGGIFQKNTIAGALTKKPINKASTTPLTLTKDAGKNLTGFKFNSEFVPNQKNGDFLPETKISTGGKFKESTAFKHRTISKAKSFKSSYNNFREKTKLRNTRVGRFVTNTRPVQAVSNAKNSFKQSFKNGGSKVKSSIFKASRFAGNKVANTKVATKIAGGFSKVAGGTKFGASKLFGATKAIGSKIPFLDVLTAGTNLIGINKKNAGSKIGATGGTLAGTMAGSATGAAIGSVIPGLGTGVGGLIGGAVGGIGGSAIGKKIGATIQKSLPKGIFKPITTAWHRVTKMFSSNFGKPLKKTWNSIKSIFTSTFSKIAKSFKPVTSGWNKFQKALNTKKGQSSIRTFSAVVKTALIPLKLIFTGLGIAFKAAMSVVKAIAKGISSFLENIFGGLFKVVGGIFKVGADLITGKWSSLGKDLSSIGKGLVQMLISPFKAVWDSIGSIVDDIKATFGKLVSKTANFIKHPIQSIKSWAGFANGTTSRYPNGLPQDTHALVNDGYGREIIRYPNGAMISPKGRNVHMFLPKGSHVFNAHDSEKIKQSGLTPFKNGTISLNDYGHNNDISAVNVRLSNQNNTPNNRVNKVTNNIKNAYKRTTTAVNKQLKSINTSSNNSWTKTNKQTTDQLSDMNKSAKNITSNLSNTVINTSNNIKKQLKPIWNDVAVDFKNALSRLSPFAHDDMSGAVGQLNNGIKGINVTLSQFGGNDNVLKPIHYATGTGPVDKTHLAMVNDSKSGPSREAIIGPQGSVRYMKSDNALTFIRKGESVLNGHDTATAISKGYIPRYASGKNSHEMLMKLAANNYRNPKNAWHNDFSSHISSTGNQLQSQLTNNYSKSSDTVGIPWYKQVWGVINSYANANDDYHGSLVNNIKKQLGSKTINFIKNVLGSVSNPSGSSVERWRPVIKKAANYMHTEVSDSDMNALLARIAKESGGNPTIMQKVQDINSASGHPAQGLYQYVPATFEAWAVPGHTNLLSGYDQTLDVFNDSNWRDDIRMPGGWGPTGHRMRFAGGKVDKNELSMVNEKGPELAINPNTQSFRTLGNGKPALVRLNAGEHVVTANNVKRLIKNGANVSDTFENSANNYPRVTSNNIYRQNQYHSGINDNAGNSIRTINNLNKRGKNVNFNPKITINVNGNGKDNPEKIKNAVYEALDRLISSQEIEMKLG